MVRSLSLLTFYLFVLCLAADTSATRSTDESSWEKIAEGDFHRSRAEIEQRVGSPVNVEPDILLCAISVDVARYDIVPGKRGAREGRIYYRGDETLGFATLYEIPAKRAVDDFVRKEGERIVYRGEYSAVARARYNRRLFLAVVSEGTGSVAFRVRDELFEAMTEAGDIPFLRPGCDSGNST